MATIKAFVLIEAEPARVRDLKDELDQMELESLAT